MPPTTLEILFQINGIGSASGIVYKDNTIYLIADNGLYLYRFQIQNQKLEKIALFKNTIAETIPKKQKPDFEAIVNYGDLFYVFGSGATKNRNRMVQYNTNTKEIKPTDLSNLYHEMQRTGNISPENFNIEGVVFTGETWYFLQRGNGEQETNGIFTFQGKNFENTSDISFNSYSLPEINGVTATFTDAVLVSDFIYFLAAAENSQSTYEDGEILGSLIGRLQLKTMTIDFTEEIANTQKFEGITLYKNYDDKIEFLLCEDNDTEAQQSMIYKLTLKK